MTDLPRRIAGEPAIADVLGRATASLAVPEAARAAVFAALVETSRRSPSLVTVPTTTMAERLADDLRVLLGDDRVELFPAWETLPFERVSPGGRDHGPRACGRCGGSAGTARSPRWS
ncbi:MAG: hypothetical protein U5R31_02095 [Acidimicrobiia bacterium]|nr:hypothetical protein [Acidimicrobiia bacterium]